MAKASAPWDPESSLTLCGFNCSLTTYIVCLLEMAADHELRAVLKIWLFSSFCIFDIIIKMFTSGAASSWARMLSRTTSFRYCIRLVMSPLNSDWAVPPWRTKRFVGSVFTQISSKLSRDFCSWVFSDASILESVMLVMRSRRVPGTLINKSWVLACFSS